MDRRGPGRVRDVTLRVACAQLTARPLAEARGALADILSAIARAARARAAMVVLPECAYPGYVLLDCNPYRLKIPSADTALARIAAAAAHHRIHVCVGLARHDARGLLRNEAILIDARGREIGAYAKSYLWGFDGRWFVAGRRQPVFQTEFGAIGMMICADGRVPEIARALAQRHAWLILDPTAWVSYGPSYDAMTNPQADFMLRVRALENGTWIAAADKCGSENNAVYYVGRSQIVAPDGRVVAVAGSAKSELIVAAVSRPQRRNTISLARSTAVGRHVVHAAGRDATHTAGRHNSIVWLGVYQTAKPAAAADKVALKTLRAQGAELIVRTDTPANRLRAALRSCVRLRAAVIEGRAMAAPESARAAARAGVDVLFWVRPPLDLPVIDFARTRALESRVYVVVCVPPRRDVSACLIDPNGTVVAAALRATRAAFFAPVDVAAARRKLVVPGTTAVAPA